MRPDVHPGRVEVGEPGRVRGGLAVDEIERRGQELLVDRLHALGGQRPGVLDLTVRGGLDHAARPEALAERGVLRIVRVLRLLLGVEVVEVAEELVEAVVGRQELVLVAEVVLAELAGRVAERLQHLGDGGVFGLQADVRPRQPDLGQSGADRRLAGDEGGAPGGAALLAVPVGEERALLRDAVDVGRPVAHHPEVVGAHVQPADVVGHDHEDVGLVAGFAAVPAVWSCACATPVPTLPTQATKAASLTPASRAPIRLPETQTRWSMFDCHGSPPRNR